MGGKYGMKETKELLAFGFAGYAGYGFASSDGKLDFRDVQYLMAVIAAAGPAFDNVALVPSELGEMDKEDAADLLAYAGQVLPGIVGAELAEAVNAFLTGLVHILRGVALLRNQKVVVDVKQLPLLKAKN